MQLNSINHYYKFKSNNRKQLSWDKPSAIYLMEFSWFIL